LPQNSLFAYLKNGLHFSPSTMMYLGVITSIAWLIKPVQGFLCDNYLNKKKWIIISLIGSILIAGYIGLINFLPLYLLILLMIIANFNATIRDVANDGMMCVEGKLENECSSIQTVQWIAITLSGIFVGLLGGWLADHCSYKIAYLCLIPIYLIILGIVSKYNNPATNKLNKSYRCKKCKHSRDGQCVPKNYKKLFPPYRDCFEKKESLMQSILSYKELFSNKPFLLGCWFILLYNFNPSFGTPLEYIQLDNFHWSFTFIGILQAIASIISILGAILYWKLRKKINLKKVLYWSVFVGAFDTLCYLYFTPITSIIYGMAFSFIGMIIFLNFMTFMAESTLPGKEAMSFALLCSIKNIAGTLSGLSGAWLLPRIGLTPLIIISSMTSFLCLPLIKKLDIK
jgi:predicted MFS family arabinose efflux permease